MAHEYHCLLPFLFFFEILAMKKPFHAFALFLCVGALTACSSSLSPARGESAGTTDLSAAASKSECSEAEKAECSEAEKADCADKDPKSCAVESEPKTACCSEESSSDS